MIDLNKSLEVFNPEKVTKRVHIIGCGAVGSHVAEIIARLGITKIALYDDDVVASHNIANQNFVFNDIGRPKTEVVAERILAINPECDIQIHGRWEPEGMMSGTAILCVDSVVPRQKMAEFMLYNPKLVVADFRMGLFSGQFYLATYETAEYYAQTLNFTDEEADKNVPMSACHFELSVVYSIWSMLGYGFHELVKYWNDPQNYKPTLTTVIDMDAGVIRI